MTFDYVELTVNVSLDKRYAELGRKDQNKQYPLLGIESKGNERLLKWVPDFTVDNLGKSARLGVIMYASNPTIQETEAGVLS